MTATAPAPAGHNSNASADELQALMGLETGLARVKLRGVADEHAPKLDSLEARVAKWTEAGIKSDLEAGLVRDLRDEAHKLGQAIDADLETRKRPLMDALTKLRALFSPLATRAETVKASCVTLETAWMQAERNRRAAEAEEAERVARAAREAAQAAAQTAAADPTDTFARMDAHDAEHQAEMATANLDHAAHKAEARPSISGYSGARASSLRTNWSAILNPEGTAKDNQRKLAHHYRDRAEVLELCLKLASAEMRTSKGQAKVPGCVAKSSERAV